MEYNSFYGGRRGASFVIVKKFDSVSDMVAAFQQGGAYKAVNYDEYVMIDCQDRNHGDNGKLFRRGYNHNAVDEFGNATGGAIFEGQIVGPVGQAPHVEIGTVADVNKRIEDAKAGQDDPDGFNYRISESSYNLTNDSLVPGAIVENGEPVEFNDSINWKMVSLRDNRTNTETIALVGFTFPVLTMNFTAESVEPYDSDGNYLSVASIQRTDDQTHPFYEKWHLGVPQGVKGDSITGFYVKEVNGKDRLVYDMTVYDNIKAGEVSQAIDLGPYNIIEGINLADNGTITVSYSHNDNTVFDKALKSIKSATLTQAGKLTVTYNTGEVYTTNLKWIADFTITETGATTFVYNDGTTFNGPTINYIVETVITKDYHLLVMYSDPTKQGTISYNGKNGWYDLGVVKSESGIYVGASIETTEGQFENQAAVITYLNGLYPQGLDPDNESGTDLKGKLIAVGGTEENKQLYAFNYNKTSGGAYLGWFYLGEVGDAGKQETILSAIAGEETDEAVIALAAQLPANGLWFVVE